MKYFALAIMLTSLFYFGGKSHAQNPETETPPIISENPETNEETIFAKASDEQIKEAEKFYNSCDKNETMSNLKDCKCAASEFLEARLKLGSEASIGEIMFANANKCLKNESANNDSGASRIDISEVTEAQLAEAEAMLKNCQATLKINRFYDCECYAAKFLDGRMELGPLVSKEEILGTFYNDCRNIVGTTGYEYTRCMEMTTARPVANIEPKDFCECYARQWAKLFGSYNGLINLSSKNQMKIRARAYCKHEHSYN